MLNWCWLVCDKEMWMESTTSHKLTTESLFCTVVYEFVWKLRQDYLCVVGLGSHACMHAQCLVVCRDVSIGVSVFSVFALASGLTGVIQEVAVWLSTACPHFEKFEAPEAWAPFSPTAAPELCLTLHTKWRLCVTNWFQLAVAMVSTLEGAVGGRRGGGCVTWPHREMSDVMWRVWWSNKYTHWCNGS